MSDPKKEIIRILTELDNALTDVEIDLQDLLDEVDLADDQHHAVWDVIMEVDRSNTLKALEALGALEAAE